MNEPGRGGIQAARLLPFLSRIIFKLMSDRPSEQPTQDFQPFTRSHVHASVLLLLRIRQSGSLKMK